jgi:hypothetical protein
MTNEELIADATKVAAFMMDPDETTGMNKCGALIGQLIDALREAEAENARLREALTIVMNELGVPGEDYPAPVTNAYSVARRALGGTE